MGPTAPCHWGPEEVAHTECSDQCNRTDTSFCSFCVSHQGQLSTGPRLVDLASLTAPDWHAVVLHA